MATIAEIKKQYPQYANVPEKELADAFHEKYYKDVPKGDFYKAVGYNESWKEALGRGGENLVNEWKNPLKAVENTVYGVGKGASDIIDGGAQLLTRGLAGATGVIAPGSAIDQFMQSERQRVEDINQKREDGYQKLTNGSVMAGVGRVGGNAAVPLGALGGANKVADAANLTSKMINGAKVGGYTAALQPVYDMDQPNASFAGQKALQVGSGAALGAAAPVVSRVGREFASATGNIVDNPLARAAEKSLVDERGRLLFGKSADAAADAQIIKDLATLKQDPLRFQQVTGEQATLGRSNAKGIGADYTDEVINMMKQSGMTDNQILNILNKNNIRSSDIASLPNTPAGRAAANAATLSVRADAMTKPVSSNTLLSPVRTAVDEILPKRFANPINAFLGGRASGESVINKLTTPRSVAAAEDVLATQGSPTGAIDDFGNFIQKAMTQKAADAEKKAAEEAAQAGALKEANIAGMRMNRAPAGGAFQSLKQYTGMADDEIVDSLRVLSNHPTLGKYADQIRQGGNTDDGAIYAVQNAINGLQKRQSGILNKTTEPGVLYKGSNVSVEGAPDISKMIYAMPDDQVSTLLGKEADTLGKNIGNAKGYLTTRASRAYETFLNGGSVPEADKALLKQLGLI